MHMINDKGEAVYFNYVRKNNKDYWVVKGIALVCDFGGLTAPEILFERKGMSGYSQPCGAPWQTFIANSKKALEIQAGVYQSMTKPPDLTEGVQPETMTVQETASASEQTGIPAPL